MIVFLYVLYGKFILKVDVRLYKNLYGEVFKDYGLYVLGYIFKVWKSDCVVMCLEMLNVMWWKCDCGVVLECWIIMG